jgi:hypothetical protein
MKDNGTSEEKSFDFLKRSAIQGEQKQKGK